jgi:hypothetical protein
MDLFDDENEWRGSVGNIIIKQGRLAKREQPAVSSSAVLYSYI